MPSSLHSLVRTWGHLILTIAFAAYLQAQTGPPDEATASTTANSPTAEERISQLEAEVAELKAERNTAPGDSQKDSQKDPENGLQKEDREILNFLRESTLNVGVDGYYEYSYNHPVGRVNLLRAYDVLSNLFSLNQASVIFEHAPDVSARRRWGGRLDLQFGQATDTLQGNPLNEPRPEIYRNIFQAFGTYVFPVGQGLTVDFGKWASSLGIEGNYTKDQWNYSRSYWFEFLPFYHMGFRGTLPLNNKLSISMWAVNGANQTEATNGFKDQLYAFTVKPKSNLTMTLNYYRAQENPDRIFVPPTSPIPVQPGLSFQAIRPAPDGRTHIFDGYGTLQITPSLTFELEGDYFIQRLWRHSGPGRSSAPSHTDGGAAYLQYQVNSKAAIATRFEYMSDRNGLFSGLSQALKENTVTFEYTVAEGFTTRSEWRRDYSNQPTFLTSTQGILSARQNTITVGLIFWWGRKTGAW